MFAVIRIRGSVDVSQDVEDTMRMLKLNVVSRCIIIPETEVYIGMLKKAKDFITWGTIDKKTLSKLLEKRGKLLGDKKIDERTLEKITKFKSFDEFSEALIGGKCNLKDYKDIKPTFKLSPPKHGYKAIRLPYPKGDLGDRKEKINDLLERMI
jgi:large subunit ribosomal protein L30